MMPISSIVTTQGNGLPRLPIVPLRFPLPHEFLQLSQLGMQIPKPRFHQGQMLTRLPPMASIYQPIMPPPPPPTPPAVVPASISVPVSRQLPAQHKSLVCSSSRNSISQHTPPFHRFTTLVTENPGTRQTSPLHGSSVTISENHVTRQGPPIHNSPACSLSGNLPSRHTPPHHRSLMFPSPGNSVTHQTPPPHRTWVCTNQSHPVTSQSPLHPGSLTFKNSKIGTHRPFTLLPGVTLEKDLPKHVVERVLQKEKATVILENGKRVRSDVWLYMGRIKLHDCGLFVKDYVACIGCKSVYPYRTKSQGTSTLRHHKCDRVFEVMKIKAARDAVKKLEEERKHQQKKQTTSKSPQFLPNIRLPVPDGLTVTLVQDIRCPFRLFKGEGRHQQRELTPEGEDRKPVMPTPPPLKEHIINSPSPQSVHPVSIHQGTPVSGGLGSGGLVNNISGRSNGSAGGCVSPAPPSSKDTPPQQLLCVKWGNFDSNIVSMFSKLRSQEHFVDVTLWCEGKTIKCHKMILSACSMYFEKLLTEYPNPHPIIFLKDMRFWEIQALVDFMYRGEVSVHQDKLPNLLQAAESLQIKGLGSPTNEMGMQGNGDSMMDEDMSNSTMDMTTSSSHNNSHLHNHINNNMKDDNGTNNNNSNNNNNHSLHHSHQLLGNNSNNNHQATWQKFGLNASNMMGIDLSNHSGTAAGTISLSSLHGTNLPLPLSLSVGSPQSGSGSQGSGGGQASKRRKKETPRRIDLPRTAGMPLPAFNSTMGSEIEEDDDAASEDSMAAHERNHVDALQSNMHQNQSYGDDEDCDQQENYEENDPGAQGEDDISSEHGQEMDEDQDGALSLRINSNLSDSERMDRERSRKGNPMKKILGIGNNNNNNEGGPQNLIHNVSSGGD